MVQLAPAPQFVNGSSSPSSRRRVPIALPKRLANGASKSASKSASHGASNDTPTQSSSSRNGQSSPEESTVAAGKTNRLVGTLLHLRSPRSVSPTSLGCLALVCLSVGLGVGVGVGAGGTRSSTTSQTPANLVVTLPPTRGMSPSPTGAEAVGLSVPSSSTPASAEGAQSAQSSIVVHAAGEVQSPGVYALRPGARVVDAVRAAGGMTPKADSNRINLAAPLKDSDRVLIPTRGQQIAEVPSDQITGPSRTDVGPSGSQAVPGQPSGTQKVDLNTASVEQLDSLPGVGPATAAAIVAHRGRIGRFTSISQLLDVPGIGDAKLAAIKPKVVIGAAG